MSDLDPYHRPDWPLLIVISGPSGVGKDSLLNRLKETRHPFHFIVTATSRPRRPGEADGHDYQFVSKEEFEAMIAHGELIEHALVYSDYKGIPRRQVREALASGKDVVVRVDVQGAAAIRRLAPEAVLIFLTAENEAELVERLRARRTEPAAELQLRLEAVHQEMNRIDEFDYVIVNPTGDLDRAAAAVMSIIRAEHCRVHPRKVTL